MSDSKNQQEPTMEEILASIRRIISEDGEEGRQEPPGDPAPSGPERNPEEVLELTQMVKEDGSVVNLANSPESEPDPDAEFEPRPAPRRPDGKDEELLSLDAATAAVSAFSGLAGALASSAPQRELPIGDGQRTLEDMVRELIRPMLKEWLDANLPNVVQRVVEREVARLARRSGNDS